LKLKHWSGALALLFAASCLPPATGVIVPGRHPCRVPADTTVRLDTVTIAFAERENEAGRLLLRLTGETLVRVDCDGRVHPALARRWTRDSSGTSWVFELDTAITAAALIQQWDLRRNGGLWPWGRILEVRAVAANRLEVRLDTVFASIPAGFAQPGLAVAPSRLPDTGPVAAIQVHPSAVDQRDLLDPSNAGSRPGVDLLITRNPAVINYARSRPGIAVVPLIWDRTYVTVTPVLRDAGVEWTEADRATLARDVVRADARAAEGPFWWEDGSCRGTMPLLPMGRLRVVVYLQGDDTGRELAERLVAVQRDAFAAGLPSEEFNASLAGGEAAVYVLSLPKVSPGNCSATPAWPSASTVVPLVDVRAHALIRAGVPSFSIEVDGTIHFDRLMPIVSLPGSAR
jgi:hypothetical protein